MLYIQIPQESNTKSFINWSSIPVNEAADLAAPFLNKIKALYILLFSVPSEQLIFIVLRCGDHCVESKHLR